jgi:hypothetical protein
MVSSIARVHKIEREASHLTMGNYISRVTLALLRDVLTVRGKGTVLEVPEARHAHPSPPWPRSDNAKVILLSIKKQVERLNFGGGMHFSEQAAGARERMYLSRRQHHGFLYVPRNTQFELDHEYEAKQLKFLRQNLDGYYAQRRFLLKPDYEGEDIWKMGWPILTDP